MAASTRFDEVEGNVFRESSRINSTWGGSLVDMVRLTIYLELIEKENLVEKAAETGTYLLENINSLQSEFPNLVSNSKRSSSVFSMFSETLLEIKLSLKV